MSSTLDRYKPISLISIVSQDLAKNTLLSIVKIRKDIPKLMIMSGPRGTGRHLLIKNYIKSMYCENLEKYSNCGTCDICRSILNDNTVYKEIDYSLIDKIEDIELPKYLVIDNFERCPREYQYKLYTWFNDLEVKPYLILITENTEDISDSLISLALILRTSLIIDKEIYKNLEEIKERLNLDINKEELEVIIRRSRGRLLNAHKMLENYLQLDKETFNQSIKSARESYIAFLISCYRNKQDDIEKYMENLLYIPLNYLKIDYEALIVEIMKVATKFEKPKDKLMELLIKEIKTKALDLYYILNDKIIYNSFDSNDKFQAAMYVIYLKLTNRVR